MSDQRKKIIDSVFSRRNVAGGLDESYVSHIKIWEDAGPEGGGRKPRYILLSEANNGTGFLHKSKLNTNGTFSVGKTWRLPELRAIQVVNPLAFNITLSRTYRWQTENQNDQSTFLEALVQLFHKIIPNGPLQLEGFTIPRLGSQKEVQSGFRHPPRSPEPASLPSGSTKPPSNAYHSRTVSQPGREIETFQRLPSPSPQSQIPARAPSRSVSPNGYPPASTDKSKRDLPSQIINPPSSEIQDPTLRLPSSTQNSHTPAFLANSQGARTSPDISASTSRYADSRPSLPVQRSGRSKKPPAREGTSDIARRDQNTRVSYYDLANQATLERLMSGNTGVSADGEGEDENTITTMSNVEEMIEGYEWASEDIITRKSSRGAADMIEARLLDELMALEKANIHSFLESDDRIAQVLKYLDESIFELDNMDSLVSSYKIHLNTVSDDIQYIQSQNRGLQVQTQNQRALLCELENLLKTVNVKKQALMTLTQESLEKSKSIERLEEAAAELYKALQAGRDTEMAATMERLQEYRTHNLQFCKRMFDFLSIMFTAQSRMLLGDNGGIQLTPGKPTLLSHQDMENYLGRYSGLMLYLKEMDEEFYAKLCAAYFSAASTLHSTQIKALLAAYLNYVRKVLDDAPEHSFSVTTTTSTSKSAAGIRRAGTIIRSPLDGRQKDKDKVSEGDLRASEVFGLVLKQLAPTIYHEDEFITDFLQINDAGLTFADYMGLDNYFRRQAMRTSGLSQSTLKLVRGAMDLIFGFLPAELKTWLDGVLEKDSMEVIGMIATLERFLADAGERANQFILNTSSKQLTRLQNIFDRHVKRQIDDIEQTKLSSKKRHGVAHFVKQFPIYVGRVENQLVGADGLEIRTTVDAAYERIVGTIFDTLKHTAKMSGEGEDKGQLNYHVIIIENMHHFMAETSSLGIGSIMAFSKRGEAVYHENLNAYIKIIIRRPFARIIDYFEGVERLLRTIAPSETSTSSAYNKSALRKVVKEYSAKDVRRHIDALFVRVGKHFAEALDKTMTEESGKVVAGTVTFDVWKACEEEVLRITDFFSKRISQCYQETGISLDYTSADVEGAFRRHRGGLP